MGNHTLCSRIPSRSLFRAFLASLCALAFCLSLLPDAEAQRRGGGYYRPSPSYRTPSYRVPSRVVTPKPLPPKPLAPKQPIPKPGPGSNVKTPTIKPTDPVAGQKDYKGQVTAKGLPVVQYKGKNWQIPQRGVSKSLKSNLLASTSRTALSSRWNPQKRQVVQKRVSALATGTAVAKQTPQLTQKESQKIHHIFGQEKHKMEPLIQKFGTQENAFRALDRAAQKAWKDGKLKVKSDGTHTQTRINVDGIDVDLVGGRILNDRFEIGSASRRDIPE